MRGITHLLFGLVLVTLLFAYYPVSSPVLGFLLVVLASLLPDIDERRSLLGRKVPVIGWLVKHRTFFHSLLFGVIVYIVVFMYLGERYANYVAAGFVGHLVLDGITPAGVRPFWPSKLKIRGPFRVGGFFEKVLYVVFVGVFVWLLFRVA